jgi:hypothetical protein
MKKIYLAVIAVLFAAGLLIGTSFFSIWGFTVLSLDEADFIQSGELPDGTFWNRPLWILEASQDGFGHRITGIFNEGEIGLESGTAPEQTFYIEMELQKQSCEYPLREETNIPPLSDFDFEVWGCFGEPTAEEAESKCPDLFDYGYTTIGNCWCIDESVQASAVNLNIETPYTHTIGEIIIGNEDVWESPWQFDTHKSETISGFAVPGKIYVRWTGYHGTDFDCDDSDQVYSWWQYGGNFEGSWRIGSAEKFRAYKGKYEGLSLAFRQHEYPSQQSFQAVIDDVNSAKDSAMVETSWGEVEDSTNIDNAKIVRDIPAPIKFPQYVFYIDAEYLGIETRAPDILINNAFLRDGCLEGSGTVDISLTNNGYSGSTIISIGDCPTGFTNVPAQTFGVEAGETKSITRSLDASVATETTGTCTVTSNDGYNVRTKTFSVCAKPFTSCTPGETKCFSDESIRECNSLGTGWDVVEDCKESCDNPSDAYCDDSDGTPDCKCEGGNGGGGGDCPSFFSDPLGWLWCNIMNLFEGAAGTLMILGLLALGVVLVLVVGGIVLLLLIMRGMGGK